MKKIGFMDENDDASGEEATINYLMQKALSSVSRANIHLYGFTAFI